MYDVKPRLSLAGDIGCALDGVALDEGRARAVPSRKPTAAFRVARLEAFTQHPCNFNRLWMRTDHAAIGGGGFAQAEQETIIDVRQPEARALPAAIVHEYLEARHPIVTNIAWHAGELRLCRYNEMVAEIDACTGFGHRYNVIEDLLKWIGRHEIRHDRSDAALRRCCGLSVGIERHARPRDVLAVTEMQMNVDHPGKDAETPC